MDKLDRFDNKMDKMDKLDKMDKMNRFDIMGKFDKIHKMEQMTEKKIDLLKRNAMLAVKNERKSVELKTIHNSLCSLSC